MNTAIAYQLENVEVRDGSRVTLRVPRWDIMAGQVLGLVGPPGAGKSTLLRLLAGLQTPSVGRLSLFGQPLDDTTPMLQRRTVTMVFQRPLLMAGMVRANVEYGLRIRGVRAPDVPAQAMLERLHLTCLADRPASAISGGQAQLVAIARALAFQPQILLLDEPTNNLDPARVALVEEVVLAE